MSDSVQLTPAPLWLRVGFWGCTVIAAAAVARRLFALASPAVSGPPEIAALDRVFAGRAALTLLHIVPALLFVAVAPFFVFRQNEWARTLLYPVGAIVGLTAYAMSRYSVGGWLELSAVWFFNTLFLFSMAQAFRYRRWGDSARERRWLVRSIFVLLGIATTRPVMGVFFATRALTHLSPSQFFGIAFWIGFSLNLAIGEFWLRRGRMEVLSK